MCRAALNARLAVVIAASVAIAAPPAYAGWSLAAFEQVQLRPAGGGEFSMFEMSNGGTIEACNAAPLPVTVSGIQIATLYQGDLKGTYHAPGATLPPSEAVPLDGWFRSELYAESQYMFLHMDSQEGGMVDIRLNPAEMEVVVTGTVPLLGFIPLAASQSYAVGDFYDAMTPGDAFSC